MLLLRELVLIILRKVAYLGEPMSAALVCQAAYNDEYIRNALCRYKRRVTIEGIRTRQACASVRVLDNTTGNDITLKRQVVYLPPTGFIIKHLKATDWRDSLYICVDLTYENFFIATTSKKYLYEVVSIEFVPRTWWDVIQSLHADVTCHVIIKVNVWDRRKG